jgi:CheY-like chemotaxis protein
MQFENRMNNTASTPQRRALVVDEDRDRYRRKDRNTALKNAGYKVYPVLRMPDARGRCKPGAFDLIIVNVAENSTSALELCDHIKNCDPAQKLFLVADEKAGLPQRDYVVSSWDDLMKKIDGNNKVDQSQPEMVAA